MTRTQWQQAEAQTAEFMNQFMQDLKQQMLQKEIRCKEMIAIQKKWKKNSRNNSVAMNR